MGRRSRVPIIRFLEKILISEELFFENAPCWIWKGALDHKSGYPTTLRMNTDEQEKPYRFSYKYFIGEIPPEVEVHHRCYRRACCNPLHLALLSHKDNTLDGDGPTAQNARATHCPQGHPYDGDNLRPAKNGGRRCRECSRKWVQEHNKRNPDYWKLRWAAGKNQKTK